MRFTRFARGARVSVGAGGTRRGTGSLIAIGLLLAAALGSGCLGQEEHGRLPVFEKPEDCHLYYLVLQVVSQIDEDADTRLRLVFSDSTTRTTEFLLHAGQTRGTFIWGVDEAELTLHVGARSIIDSNRTWLGKGEVEADAHHPTLYSIVVGEGEHGATVRRTDVTADQDVAC